MSVRVLVLSDTHVPTRAKDIPGVVWQEAKRADAILHAGDIAGKKFFDELDSLGLLYAVRGNMDPGELDFLPRERVVLIAGFRIGIVHGNGMGSNSLAIAARTFSDVDIVVFGHSHQIYNERHGDTHYLNPGSVTEPRGQQNGSYAILHLEDTGVFRIEIIYL